MQLVLNSSCLICDENTAVLTHSDTFIQFACDTFFKTNEHERNKFQGLVSNRSICILCNYKTTLAHKFKNIYEDICQKERTKKFRPVCCFICESRTNEHFETEANPNNFNVKISSFMNCSSHAKKYKRRIACIDCSFHLSVWYEVFTNISKKLNSNTEAHNSRNKMVSAHLDSTDDTSIKTNGDVSTSPDDSSSEKRHRTDSDSSSSVRQSRRSSIVDAADKKGLHRFLKETLKHLKSVEQISKKFNYNKDGIENDKKMFKEIPYILVTRDKDEGKQARISTPKPRPKPAPKSKKAKAAKKAKSKKNSDDEGSLVERKSSRLNKEPEVIVLSDTDDENKQEQENKRPVRAKPAPKKAAPLPKGKNNQKSKNTKQSAKMKKKLALQKRIPFKIRLSAKFTLPPNSVVENKWYSCNICDKLFNVNCTFKTHKLWHQKPETVVINLTRRELPDSIKASEYDPSKPIIQRKSKIDSSDKDIENMDTEESSKEVDEAENKENEMQSNENHLENSAERNDTTDITMREESKQDESDNSDNDVSVEKNDVAEDINGSNSTVEDDRETIENKDERENDLQHKENEKTNTNIEESQELQETNDEATTKDQEEEEEEDEEEGSEKDGAAEYTNHVNSDDQEDNDEVKERDENDTDDDDDEDNTDNNDSPKNKQKGTDDKVENIGNKLAMLHGEQNKEHGNDESSPSIKRKRMTNSDASDTEENTSYNNEKVTPKTKRVRFASDFETSTDDINTVNNGTAETNENLNKLRCSI